MRSGDIPRALGTGCFWADYAERADTLRTKLDNIFISGSKPATQSLTHFSAEAIDALEFESGLHWEIATKILTCALESFGSWSVGGVGLWMYEYCGTKN